MLGNSGKGDKYQRFTWGVPPEKQGDYAYLLHIVRSMMETKWGSCNHKAGHIRLNAELVKKSKDLLEYVIVHEMVHLLQPTHSDRFIAILQQHYPTWREARSELNELPLTAEVWKREWSVS